jgi:hypothetical protein
MLVGNQDAIDAFGLVAGGFEAAEKFLAVDSGIDKEASLLSFEQRSVARAARRQYRNPESDATLALWRPLRGALALAITASHNRSE